MMSSVFSNIYIANDIWDGESGRGRLYRFLDLAPSLNDQKLFFSQNQQFQEMLYILICAKLLLSKYSTWTLDVKYGKDSPRNLVI